MCSILGGTKLNKTALDIYNNAKDRGRDFSGLCELNGNWIANHRATPTNEINSNVENQPFGDNGFKFVHNGTIANDTELGNLKTDIDSKILSKVLNLNSIDSLLESVKKIKGSFAIAILKNKDIFFVCNYKPIWYAFDDDNELYFSSLKQHLEEAGLNNIKRVKPYSILNPLTNEKRNIKRTQHDNALIICSGGLDSTSIIGYAISKHKKVHLLHFNYGCKATEKELQAIKNISKKVNCSFSVVDLNFNLMQGASTLFQKDDIKSGKKGVEYALDWVPARNLIMLSLSVGFAEANNYGHLYIGTNLEEAGAYPDNEEQFILDFSSLLYGAVQNGIKIELHSPLGGLMKKEIVEFAVKHNSPIELSWSCYNSKENHCGSCGPCYMRQLAFKRAGVLDKTKYILNENK